MLSERLSASTCPACGHHVSFAFFDGGLQPLATIAWPATEEEARGMQRLPLSFVRCVECGHVFNKDFDYTRVPYSDKPNLMFNRAPIWNEHLKAVRDLMLGNLPAKAVVVEVGCGEGHVLRALAEANPSGRYLGFDPNGNVDTASGKIEVHKTLFDPAIHLEMYRPHMIASRHVLEHLMNPLGFLQRLAFAAEWLRHEVRLFIEVPCIDRVFTTGRVADFYYEHNSHFTTNSFTRMIKACATAVEHIGHGYDGEVIYAIAVIGGRDVARSIAREAEAFTASALRARETITGQLEQLHASGHSVAIWGGTGKGAAFINHYGADAKRFPIVIDSDPLKVGTFVPGTGQRIQDPAVLLQHRAQVVIIPTQWRAGDIVSEMSRRNIRCETVLIEHRGRLIDYHTKEHPYRIYGPYDAGNGGRGIHRFPPV